MLISGGSMFLAIWNYNHFDNILVTNLYRLQRGKNTRSAEYSEGMVAPLTNPIDYFCDKLPKKCQKCRRQRKIEAFEKGRDQLMSEINYYKQVVTIRYVKAAIKILLSKEQREKLWQQSQYVMLKLDEDDFGVQNSDNKVKTKAEKKS